MGFIALLLHINGAPGVGKSSLGRRYVGDHPLALLLDIDEVRSMLGQWQAHEESKLLARKVAIAMAEAHLREGHDVVVPQYVGRVEFVLPLEGVARRCDARFIEVLLDAPKAVAVERFRSRRQALRDLGEHHPQFEVPAGAVEAVVDDARASLASLAAQRSGVIHLRAGRELDVTYAELLGTIREISP